MQYLCAEEVQPLCLSNYMHRLYRLRMESIVMVVQSLILPHSEGERACESEHPTYFGVRSSVGSQVVRVM